MALPKLQVPTYSMALPSSGKKIKYRSFLVKEEKLLMIANETGDESDRKQAIAQIIENCTFGQFDTETAPGFDVEYLFLNLRSKSVGEVVDVKLLCPDDNKTYVEAQINLNDIVCEKPKKGSNTIKLEDNVGIVLKYPTLTSDILVDDNLIEVTNKSLVSIYDGDQVFDVSDFSKEEVESFVESMTQKQLETIGKFFENIPSVTITVPVTNPNTKVTSDVVLRGLDSFF
jgi:hypothetical protein